MDILSILLSRIQMTVTLGMHILFPTLNIGLALFLCCMEAAWLKSDNILYLNICKFWTKIFSLAFGMGIVSGIVMAYELGTNFGNFTLAIGEVLGSLFVYEVLTAFFLEAGFLGIMLFGWDRVSAKMHFFATLMVTIGTTVSAFWIISANSWMQTPAGYTFVDGKYHIANWLSVIFNPSFIPRFIHMLLASYISASFFIIGVSAWYLLNNTHLDIAKKCFSVVFWAALIVVPMQFIIGDTVGLNVHRYQPLKTAAIEGIWETQKGAPLVLFAYPDSHQEKNLFPMTIPKGASIINTHSVDGELIGLKTVPKEDRPIVTTTFFGFRIMVGIGMLYLLMVLFSVALRMRGHLFQCRWFHRLCVLTLPLGFVATISGWVTAETGRQPWVVYGLMRTSAGASHIAASHVAISLTAFIILYLFVLSFFLYYLVKTIINGPEPLPTHEPVPVVFPYMGQF
jgi:cytochrome bd ubiquinol oxidase subunit I